MYTFFISHHVGYRKNYYISTIDTVNFSMRHIIYALLLEINHLLLNLPYHEKRCCENACVFQSENVRWVHSVAQYREQESTLCGDVLLTAAFISYAGSFSKRYREELLHNLWMPYLRTQKVSVCDCETVYLEYWFSLLMFPYQMEIVVLKMCIVAPVQVQKPQTV